MHLLAPPCTTIWYTSISLVASPYVCINSKPCIWTRLPSWLGVEDYINSAFYSGWECNITSSLRSLRGLGLNHSHHLALTRGLQYILTVWFDDLILWLIAWCNGFDVLKLIVSTLDSHRDQRLESKAVPTNRKSRCFC